MHEAISPVPIPAPHEVQVIRKWLEEEIAGRGICPPLIKVFQARRHEGVTDWTQLENDIDIQSFKKMNPRKEGLVEAVADSYLKFITEAIHGGGAYAKIIILPDFDHNADYDDLVVKVKMQVFKTLLTPQGIDLVIRAIRNYATQEGLEDRLIEQHLRTTGIQELIIQVIEGAFNPVYFYGKPLTAEDMSDMTSGRGPKERQKVLSRSPYYLIQVVNGLNTSQIIGTLDKEKLYRRNNLLALSEDPKKFEQKMQKYKRGE